MAGSGTLAAVADIRRTEQLLAVCGLSSAAPLGANYRITGFAERGAVCTHAQICAAAGSGEKTVDRVFGISVCPNYPLDFLGYCGGISVNLPGDFPKCFSGSKSKLNNHALGQAHVKASGSMILFHGFLPQPNDHEDFTPCLGLVSA